MVARGRGDREPALIRAIQPDDWPQIDRVQHACFPATAIESTGALKSISDAASAFCSAAEENGVVVGYLLSHPWISGDLPALNEPLTGCPADADTLFIHDMALLPEARGGGLASRMVNRVLDAARERKLSGASLLSVQKTTSFWARFGFEKRPELTERFRERVFGFYEIDFEFMTAKLG
jgi:GNAT superfamily N-acetyltransferase